LRPSLRAALMPAATSDGLGFGCLSTGLI
jgi:hypothetical protein